MVPTLFAHLAPTALAGATAARLFTAQTWIALGCGLLLLLLVSRHGHESDRADWAGRMLGLVLAGMLLALLGEFAVAPRILARQDLRLWHGIGSGMYVLQWVCAGIVLSRLDGGQRTR